VLVDGTKRIALKQRLLVCLSNSVANTVDFAFHAIGSATRIPTAMMVKMKRTATLSTQMPAYQTLFLNARLSTFVARRKTTVFLEEPFATVSLTVIVERT